MSDLAHSFKWHEIVIEARKKARILPNDMDQSRSSTISEWSAAEDKLGPIPDLNNEEILKDLARCFTNKDNPAGTSRPNVQFQRDLTLTWEGCVRCGGEHYAQVGATHS